MNDREKFEHATRMLAELVRRIDALLETPEAGRLLMRDEDPDLSALLGQIGALCEDIESPSGKRGTLRVDGESGRPYIVTEARATGLRVISTEPGGFNGVVWNEEMDRAPKEER